MHPSLFGKVKHTTVNFLLDMVHRDLTRNAEDTSEPVQTLLPGFLSNSTSVIAQIINQIPRFTSDEQLNTMLYDVRGDDICAVIFYLCANLAPALV